MEEPATVGTDKPNETAEDNESQPIDKQGEEAAGEGITGDGGREAFDWFDMAGLDWTEEEEEKNEATDLSRPN